VWKRKNPDSAVRCYRYRAWLKTHRDGFSLPESIYAAAIKRREFWNLLVTESEQRYERWLATHPPVPALNKEGTQKISRETRLPIMKTPKPDKGYWDSFLTWAREHADASGLNWEDAPDILDRFMAVFKRMSTSGGGAPKARRSLHRFAFLHRYTGGGLPVANLANDRQRRARILFPPSDAYLSNSRERRRARLAPAWFEIDGETLSLAVLLHRELPLHSKVKKVYLAGSRQSPVMRWQYALIFTVETPSNCPLLSPPNLGIGIDVRWRKLDEDRLHVVTIYDGKRHQELFLPLRFSTSDLGEVSLERIERAQALQSECLNKCKAELRQLLSILPPGFEQMGRKALFLLMQQSEEQGQKEAASLIKRYLRDHSQYRRIALLAENRLHGRRQHLYQNFAVGLARRYGSWNVENIAIKNLKEQEGVHESVFRPGAKYRDYASPGLLLQILKHAAKKYGIRFYEVPPEHTTDRCARCGAAFEAGPRREGRCAAGHRSYQDWNAAENIFANPKGFQGATIET